MIDMDEVERIYETARDELRSTGPYRIAAWSDLQGEQKLTIAYIVTLAREVKP